MTPTEIRANFKAKFTGTDEELHDCIWDLIDDLLDTVLQARNFGGDEYSELQDYVVNHYG